MARVVLSPNIEKQLKRLLKKFPSLKKELPKLFESLESDPTQGIFIGKICYKIRLAIASKGRGKRGGARIISCFQLIDNIVYLVYIYDKSEQETIQDDELDEILRKLGLV
jgi:mRNA-degrading endonuclease RelE of RelBE toxin-antitoxin system